VRVERNFLHHNERDGGGYGVNVSRAVILGNVFLMNRHAISGGGETHNEYRAAYNIVLSRAPYYGYFNQDFDMHGTADPKHWYGGNGGYHVDIVGNTFLVDLPRVNYELRGIPCIDTNFHENIAREPRDIDFAAYYWLGDRAAVHYKDTRHPITWDISHINTSSTRDQFELPDPTVHLGVGDFDGDGVQDLFVATGSAWYYSSGGKTEWRFLSAKTETLPDLLFGDFDCDGRTDVFTQMVDPEHPGRYKWMVSWAGISPWEEINNSQWSMTDFYVGDFVGDCRADVFFARGDQWFVSDGGRGPFFPYATASQKVSELLFGDFDGDGKMDVVGIHQVGIHGDEQYKVVYAKPDPQGHRSWTPLALCGNQFAPRQIGTSMKIADFDGNGISDVVVLPHYFSLGQDPPNTWYLCPDGTGNPIPLSQDLNPMPLPYNLIGVGNFDETRKSRPGADILFWDYTEPGPVVVPRGHTIEIVSSGRGPMQPHSREDMR
jgi:hypothetical protein